jgi:hypothetical protein
MSTPPRVLILTTAVKNYAVAGVEPALSEVLNDPIVHLLMGRDGVTREALELLIQKVRQDRLAVQSAAGRGCALIDMSHLNGRLAGEDPIRRPVA